MSSDSEPRLSQLRVPEQLVELGPFHALWNARNLLADAQLLYQHGRQARAMALLAIVNEELAKALMLVEAKDHPNDAVTDKWWGTFLEDWSDHGAKLDRAMQIDHVLLGMAPDVVAHNRGNVRTFIALKEWALYLDFYWSLDLFMTLDGWITALVSQGQVANLADFLAYQFEITTARLQAVRTVLDQENAAVYLRGRKASSGPVPEPKQPPETLLMQAARLLGLDPQAFRDPKGTQAAIRREILRMVRSRAETEEREHGTG